MNSLQISVLVTNVSKALISLLCAKMPENAKKAEKRVLRGEINVKIPSVKAGGNQGSAWVPGFKCRYAGTMSRPGAMRMWI